MCPSWDPTAAITLNPGRLVFSMPAVPKLSCRGSVLHGQKANRLLCSQSEKGLAVFFKNYTGPLLQSTKGKDPHFPTPPPRIRMSS